MKSGEWTVIGAILAVLGSVVYGFIAWVLKRLIMQLDELVKTTQALHDSALKLDMRVTALEAAKPSNHA